MDWEPYQYHKLHYRHAIRVIKLLPASRHEDEIRCLLIHTTLHHYEFDIGEYTALSYVWGNPEDKVPIIIEDKPLLVTQNLDSALRHIRHARKEILLWADAICINQTDDEEKSQQVAQMGDVYKNASRTIIFLGEGTVMSDQLFTIMESNPTKSSKLQFDSNLVLSILGRPWFLRAWTFQELILSKDPWVQVGNKIMRWNQLCHVLSHDTKEYQTLRDMDTSRKLVTERDFFKLNTSSEFLRFLLMTIVRRRGVGAQDPRDIIYAHLGVAREVIDRRAGVEDLIRVNYEKPHNHSYAQFAFKILGSMQNYHLLSHVAHDGEFLNETRTTLIVPSWSPDWSNAGLRLGQRSLRDAFMRKIDDPGNLEGGWENEMFRSSILLAPIPVPSNLNSNNMHFKSGFRSPSWVTDIQYRGLPFGSPNFSRASHSQFSWSKSEEFEERETFPEQEETLPPRLSEIYCKMASQLASPDSQLKSLYWLPTLGYTLGQITRLSNVAPHYLTSFGAMISFPPSAPSAENSFDGSHDCRAGLSRLDVMKHYQRFLDPIQIPIGDAHRFPNTNKLDPSKWDKKDLSHRSQWLADHIILHHLTESEGKRNNSSYKPFLEGKRFAEFQNKSEGGIEDRTILGLVAESARVGDIAVRLLGSDIPFLLRPVALELDHDLKSELDKFFVLEMTGELTASREHMGFYEFVGEAFVEQAMFEQGTALCDRGVFGEKMSFFFV